MINLSQPKHTPAGKFLGYMYYSNKDLIELFKMVDERSGFPNDGGRHTLHLHNVTVVDVLAFLKLIIETQISHPMYQQAKFAFVSEALKRLQRYPDVPRDVRSLMAA
jgi:hypothetical protein